MDEQQEKSGQRRDYYKMQSQVIGLFYRSKNSDRVRIWGDVQWCGWFMLGCDYLFPGVGNPPEYLKGELWNQRFKKWACTSIRSAGL